jgi:hypothetical protein
VKASSTCSGISTLIVEERLDPEAVHKAFLVIDEYADLFDAEDE